MFPLAGGRNLDRRAINTDRDIHQIGGGPIEYQRSIGLAIQHEETDSRGRDQRSRGGNVDRVLSVLGILLRHGMERVRRFDS